MESKVFVIIGMGPGIGMALVERFAKEGYTIAMISRNEGRLSLYLEILERQLVASRYFVGDASNPASLTKALDRVSREVGHPEVLVYNAAKVKKLHVLEESADSLAEDFIVNVGSALEAVKTVLPVMQIRGGGSILFTGGGFALHPNPEFASLSIGKAGLRNLASQLHTALKGTGIKVATLTVQGFVSKNSDRHNPAAIAEQFWQLHQAPEGTMDFELQY